MLGGAVSKSGVVTVVVLVRSSHDCLDELKKMRSKSSRCEGCRGIDIVQAQEQTCRRCVDVMGAMPLVEVTVVEW